MPSFGWYRGLTGQIPAQVSLSYLFVCVCVVFFGSTTSTYLLNFFSLLRQRRDGDSLNIRIRTYTKFLKGIFQLAVSLAVAFCHCPFLAAMWLIFSFLLKNHLAVASEVEFISLFSKFIFF